jgi:crotonobetainyl-CoA:carnitine CoA-transferase CaiB-like acyl-CoA transferase
VVKVESLRRPDGARFGPRGFYDRLHQGQEAVALDFASAEGRAHLARLIARADVVIEGSRPRALEQLGIDLAAVFAARPGLVWISLTAYGRSGPWRERVGFGDDCAAAGGLVAWNDAGAPCFVGDALADPVAGLAAAAAGFAALRAGGGMLVDVALREAAAFVADAEAAPAAPFTGRLLGPAARPPAPGPAAEMGAHTAALLAEFA